MTSRKRRALVSAQTIERGPTGACRRVGKDAQAVAAVARDLGVGWATIMRAVADHGTPLADDSRRLNGVATLAWMRPASSRPPGSHPPDGWPGWLIWSAAACWRWWPTAAGLRWTADSAPSLKVGWPGWPRLLWTPGAATPAP
jgi:hypothetical protein